MHCEGHGHNGCGRYIVTIIQGGSFQYKPNLNCNLPIKYHHHAPFQTQGPKFDTEPTPTRSANNGIPRPGYKGHAATHVPSRDGDPYNFPDNRSTPVSTPDNADVLRDKYSRSNGVGDVYSRGEANLDSDRGALFAGYSPQKGQSNRFVEGPQDSGEGNDEDVEGIKTQTRFLKQDSVNTTRNALRMAPEKRKKRLVIP